MAGVGLKLWQNAKQMWSANVRGFDRTPGDYTINFVNADLPSPGTGNKAYANNDLVPFMVAGTGAYPIKQWRAVPYRPVYALPASYVSGIPTIAGQLYSQPLYNPAVEAVTAPKQGY